MSQNESVKNMESTEAVILGDITKTGNPNGSSTTPHSSKNRNHRSPTRVVASPTGAQSENPTVDEESAVELARLAAEAKLLRPSRGTAEAETSVLNQLNPHSELANGDPSTPLNGSSTSSSRSNSSSQNSATATEKYSFAAFCRDEELEIAKQRTNIRNIVAEAVAAELKAVGPIAATSTALRTPNFHLHSTTDDGTTVVTVAATGGPALASEANANMNLKTLSPISLTQTVSERLTAIGQGIERERQRINSSTQRQQHRLHLASQGLYGGGTAKKARSTTQTALAARKALAESSEFVECVFAAISLSAILGGDAMNVSYLQRSVALSVLAAFSQTFQKYVGDKSNSSSNEGDACPIEFSVFIRNDAENIKSSSSAQTLKSFSNSSFSLAQNMLIKLNTDTDPSALLRSVIESLTDQATAKCPLASVIDLSESLSDRLHLSAFSSFVLGKELFLAYKQNSPGSPNYASAAEVEGFLSKLKEQFLLLFASILLLTHAAHLGVPVGKQEGLVSSPQSLYVDALAAADDLGSTVEHNKGKPSSLTPLPKPFFAGDVFYFLGCAVRSLHADFSNINKAVLKPLEALAPSSSINEWKVFHSMVTQWMPYQAPAALVALGNRCLDRFEAQEDSAENNDDQATTANEAGTDEGLVDGNLTMPTCIETRDSSDKIFICVTPQLCAIECLSLTEGNHGNAWQLLAETLSTTDCVEIGDHKLQRAQNGPLESNAAESMPFLRGGAIGGGQGHFNSPMFSALSQTQGKRSVYNASWDGGLYLGEHTKTSAYVEAIRCQGGIAACTHPSYLAKLWLPLAQSMFFSRNPDIGAEEVLIPCHSDTWFGDQETEVAKLNKQQILEHIIALDRTAVPVAYLELGMLASMGYRKTEKRSEGGNILTGTSADDGDLEMSDEAKKKIEDVKSALKAAKATADGVLSALVEEQIALADEYLPEDDAKMTEVSGLATQISEYLNKYFGTETISEFPENMLDPASERQFKVVLSQTEEKTIFSDATILKLKSVEEEVITISFQPLLQQKIKSETKSEGNAQDSTSQPSEDNKASQPSYPAPLRIRKMDCFCLSLSLEPRIVKTWVKLALGLEDKLVCKAKETISQHEACAVACSRLLAINEIKQRVFGSLEISADAKKKWSSSTLPRLLQTLKSRTAPNEEAFTRANLLSYGGKPSQYTSFDKAVLQYDPLVYQRTLFGMGEGGGASGTDITVTRVEALMRALSCDKKDPNTWFILGTTLAERELLREQCMKEYRTIEAKRGSSEDSCADMVSRIAYHKVRATNESVFPLTISVPKYILAPSDESSLGQNDEGDTIMISVGGRKCFEVAMQVSAGTSLANGIRSLIAQWCKKNNYEYY